MIIDKGYEFGIIIIIYYFKKDNSLKYYLRIVKLVFVS